MEILDIITLFVAPVIVGMVLELFSYWLSKKDDK